MEVVNKVLKLSGVLGIFAMCCLGYSVKDLMKQRNSHICVNGLADRVIKSDEAKLNISFTVEGNKMSDLKTTLASTSGKVIEFLHKYGFNDDEVAETSDEITDRLADRYARYGGGNNVEKPENRYELKRTITVKTKQVDAVKSLNSHLSDLYEQDICATASASYSSSDFAKIRLDLLDEATTDAKVRVKKIAEAAGVKVRGLRNISTGKFTVLNADENRLDGDYWSDGERSYLKRYRIIVNATFDRN